MVKHWWLTRSPGWRSRLGLNGFGAVLTAVAAVVVMVSKFTEGGWLILVTVPVLVVLMEWIHRSYRRIGARLELGRTPPPPRPHRSLVVVPVGTVSRLTRDALAAALSLGDRVEAVYIGHPDDEHATRDFLTAWENWNPGVRLIQLHDERRRLAEPLIEHLGTITDTQVFVLIPEVEPEHLWERVLQNQRGAVLAHALRRRSSAVICRLRFRISPTDA